MNMIGKVTVTSHLPFELDGKQPKRLHVRCTSAPGDATQTYSVIADYGWAERILCSGSYLRDANDIADALGEALLIPVDLATAEAA
jgi:hypothetical protein